MGTELGDSNFSLGHDASPELRLVAATRPQHSTQFSSFPDRSCARLLSHLRLSMASAAEQNFLPLEWNQMLERTGGRAPHFHPRADSDPDNCEANRKEGENYLRAVLEESDDVRVIGEDLGAVPDYVRPSLRSLGVAGFKIPQWEFYHGRVTPGTEYERLSVATYATHDHPPVRAMWEEAFGDGAVAEQARSDLEK